VSLLDKWWKWKSYWSAFRNMKEGDCYKTNCELYIQKYKGGYLILRWCPCLKRYEAKSLVSDYFYGSPTHAREQAHTKRQIIFKYTIDFSQKMPTIDTVEFKTTL
jgi:hypothetical protein